VIKLEIGQDPAGRWVVGSVHWKHTECVRSSPGTFIVRPGAAKEKR